jgi:hypothetical protein
LSEVLKSLWGKLYAWALPSALTLGVYWLFVYPETKVLHGWLDAASDGEKTAIFVGLSGGIAFCLSTFSTHLYRILEGYLLWPRWLQKRRRERQLQRKRELEQALSGIGWMRGLAIEKLALYPLRDDQVVPTRFGNAIRSFEQYGKTRFNLDSQTLWYELCAVAPKYIQNELNSTRSSVDFFVASFYLSAALGVTTFVVGIFEGFSPSVRAVCVSAFFVSLLCHWLLMRATGEWGFAVQALVNVARIKLAESLGLELPESLDEEKVMWGLVTSFVYFGNAEDGAKLDRFRKKKPAVQPLLPRTEAKEHDAQKDDDKQENDDDEQESNDDERQD